MACTNFKVCLKANLTQLKVNYIDHAKEGKSVYHKEQKHSIDLVDRICSVVHRGVSHNGRFVGGGARNQEPDGDTRHRDNDLDRFGPSDRHNTLVLHLWCIVLNMRSMEMSTRGPLPLLIYSRGERLQGKYPIWFYTIFCGAHRPVPCTP